MYRTAITRLITRVVCAVMLACLSAMAQAQFSDVPEFLTKHFHAVASDAQSGPKLNTQFEYIADDTLLARSEMRLNADGFEDQMAVGLVQNFSTGGARIVYNLHRVNNSDVENQSDDITFDLYYRSLRFQRRMENTMQVSTLAIPFDLFAVQMDLAVSQTQERDSAEAINVYSVSSRLNYLKFSAALKDLGDDTLADFSTELRPANNWLVKFSYSNNGDELQRKLRSEYVASGYRLAAEYNSLTLPGEESRRIGAIGIERETSLAALKLHLEYDEAHNSPAVSFQVESRIDL